MSIIRWCEFVCFVIVFFSLILILFLFSHCAVHFWLLFSCFFYFNLIVIISVAPFVWLDGMFLIPNGESPSLVGFEFGILVVTKYLIFMRDFWRPLRHSRTVWVKAISLPILFWSIFISISFECITFYMTAVAALTLLEILICRKRCSLAFVPFFHSANHCIAYAHILSAIHFEYLRHERIIKNKNKTKKTATTKTTKKMAAFDFGARMFRKHICIF